MVTQVNRKVNKTAGFSPLLQLDFTIKLTISGWEYELLQTDSEGRERDRCHRVPHCQIRGSGPEEGEKAKSYSGRDGQSEPAEQRTTVLVSDPGQLHDR